VKLNGGGEPLTTLSGMEAVAVAVSAVPEMETVMFPVAIEFDVVK
jgi:hypothetical protein